MHRRIVRFKHRRTIIGLLIGGCLLVCGNALAPVASANSCGEYNECAYANANYGGGWIGDYGYGEELPDFTKLGGPYSGCTHTSFNDCASSIKNAGPWEVRYYWNAGFSGPEYFNEKLTGTTYIGEYWNDEWSSSVVGAIVAAPNGSTSNFVSSLTGE